MTSLDYLINNPVAFISTCCLFGLMVGSFLNVVIYRLPKMMESAWQAEISQALQNQEPPDGITPPEKDQAAPGVSEASPERFNLVTPRSRCPECGNPVNAADNIPVLSYLLLKGKCRFCSTPISVRYPIVELLTGLLCGVVAWSLYPDTNAVLPAIILTFCLIALTGIDFDTYLLPDSITLPLLWLGLIVNYFGVFTTLENALWGAIAGYLILWCVFWLFKLITGKEGMGYGDFKLLAALGAWLGWQMLPVIIILSSLVGALVGIAMIVFANHEKSKPIPFGPYLAAAGWLALIWGEQINQAYLNFIGFN